MIKEKLNELIKELKQLDNYVPRNYQSMGGMWTTETWQKGNLRLQIMDEGYTNKLSYIINDNVDWSITETFNGKEIINYEGINEKEFLHQFDSLKNTLLEKHIPKPLKIK